MSDKLNINNEIEEQVEELENATPTNANTADDVVFDEDAELGDNQIVKKLREKLRIAIEEKQTYLDGWQRDRAEFMNARKRDEEAKQEFLKFAKLNVIEDILPVLDSFDMAMANKVSWESISTEWRSGVEGIYNQLLGVLSKQGVASFGVKGDAFDPNLHQSVSMVPTDDKSKDHTVATVLQKGYMLSGKVVRPAMVQVFEV